VHPEPHRRFPERFVGTWDLPTVARWHTDTTVIIGVAAPVHAPACGRPARRKRMDAAAAAGRPAVTPLPQGLTERLTALVAGGVLIRRPYTTTDTRVDYVRGLQPPCPASWVIGPGARRLFPGGRTRIGQRGRRS
jgi:hypothetical protein